MQWSRMRLCCNADKKQKPSIFVGATSQLKCANCESSSAQGTSILFKKKKFTLHLSERLQRKGKIYKGSKLKIKYYLHFRQLWLVCDHGINTTRRLFRCTCRRSSPRTRFLARSIRWWWCGRDVLSILLVCTSAVRVVGRLFQNWGWLWVVTR